MTELSLSRDERLALRARAHHLKPTVLLGHNGLTDAVVREIERALTSHALIKVKVPSDDRAEREAVYAKVADVLGAARIVHIGKLLVLYRPKPEAAQDKASVKTAARKQRRGARKDA